ncbi:DUF2306 domain-containing protein [Actinokineospora xionganensis]|uniref:DUF2306 domain-containing protein n=1 Tax=Actinokineospora xionganensis TaxID=2684470 RepID=A0ABR7LD80_9PSEU|nr:DUF2306 domain-containing protein [Actinokineospora xionganensis]MBC6450247.1 DUF2306 domain-containing protein [Actinokineospora xionganensis]
MRDKRWSWVAWAAVAAVCVIYAPMAIEYTWRLFNPSAPGLWDRVFAGAVGDEQALGAGSIHHEQADAYAENRVLLLFHTTAGGIAILIFAAQFSARFRRNLRRHRVLGRVGVTLALVGMLGAFGYLLAVGPEHTFDGPAFYLQLWALALGTLIGVIGGFATALRRQIAMHRSLMAYAFALLLTAPLLRIEYVLLGVLWSGTTQVETNLAGGATLATLAPLGAILASRAMAGRDRRSPTVRPLPGRNLDRAVGIAALATLPLLVLRYTETFDGTDRITIAGMCTMLAGLAAAATNAAAARKAGKDVAAEEWRVHTLAFVASVPAMLLLWLAYDAPFTTGEAFFGALLTAPAVTLSMGLLLVVWRRRTVVIPQSDQPKVLPI